MQKDEFTDLLESKLDTLFLDIRESDELIGSDTIPGSKHMPMGKVFCEASQDNLPKDRLIVVFCRSGMRAGIVARELGERGYRIEGLEGGLNGLKE